MDGLHQRSFSTADLQIQEDARYAWVPVETIFGPDQDVDGTPDKPPQEADREADPNPADAGATGAGTTDADHAGAEGQMLSVVNAEGHVIAKLPSGQDPAEAARSIRLLAEASRLYDLASFAARNFRAPGPCHAAGEEADPDDLPQQPHRWSRSEMDAAVRAMLDSYAETCASLVREIETGEPIGTAGAAA